MTGVGAVWSTTTTTAGGAATLKPVAASATLTDVPSAALVSVMSRLAVTFVPERTRLAGTTSEKV